MQKKNQPPFSSIFLHKALDETEFHSFFLTLWRDLASEFGRHCYSSEYPDVLRETEPHYQLERCTGDFAQKLVIFGIGKIPDSRVMGAVADATQKHFDNKNAILYNQYWLKAADKHWVVLNKEQEESAQTKIELLHDNPLRGKGPDELNIERLFSALRFSFPTVHFTGEKTKSIIKHFKKIPRAEKRNAIRPYLGDFLKSARFTRGIILYSEEGRDEDPGLEYVYSYRDADGTDYTYQVGDSIHWPGNEQWRKYTNARRPGAPVWVWHDRKHPGLHYWYLADEDSIQTAYDLAAGGQFSQLRELLIANDKRSRLITFSDGSWTAALVTTSSTQNPALDFFKRLKIYAPKLETGNLYFTKDQFLSAISSRCKKKEREAAAQPETSLKKAVKKRS